MYCCQSPGHEAFLFERAGDLRHHLEIHHHDELELEDIADILEGGALPSMDIWHLLVGYDPTDQDHETPLCRLCGQTAVSTDASASSATRIEWLLNHIGSHFEDIALQCLHAQLLDDDLASAGSEIALDADLSIRDVHELPPVIENASEASTMQATSTASEAGSLGASSLSVLPNSNLEGEGEPPSSDRAIPSLNEDSGGELRSVTDLAQPTTDSKAFNPPVSGVSQPDRHLYAMSESLPPMMETDGPELIVAVDFGMTCKHCADLLMCHLTRTRYSRCLRQLHTFPERSPHPTLAGQGTSR